MEEVLKDIEKGSEDAVQASLSQFNSKNATNFSIGEAFDTRKEFCSTLLSHVGSSDPSISWAAKTQALALTSLKILAREREGTEQLISQEGLLVIVKLAELSNTKSHFRDYESKERVEVLVEAVKCLCNILLNNRHLASTLDQLGCLSTVTQRLSLCHAHKLPYELIQFDLRLLFLITACGASERMRCREECNGILIMVNMFDSILFGPTVPDPVAHAACSSDKVTSSQGSATISPDEVRDPHMAIVDEGPPGDHSHQFQDVHVKSKVSARLVQDLAPVRGAVYCLSSPVDDKACILLHDTLKILFNQTLGWVDKDCEGDELEICIHLAHLLRILLVSIKPVQASKAAMQTIVHAIEVLVNIPEKCANCLLVPSHVRITQDLSRLYPTIFSTLDKSTCITTENIDIEDRPYLYKCDVDQIFDDWNMAAIISLLNFLDQKLLDPIERHSLSPVLTALRLLSKGHRSIRRFLKAELLPPMHEFKDRPEVGDTLKSRIVRLMVAGTHGAEEVTAEFLFVLCKENANRLVKHTGYGNAAGLLLAHGLLAGGIESDSGQDNYSSDSETSDTEEYKENKKHIDPVTGGPVKKQPSSLDEMTDEEKEREAEKLEGLLRRLDKHGIIKVMPLDQHNQPLRPTEESNEETN